MSVSSRLLEMENRLIAVENAEEALRMKLKNLDSYVTHIGGGLAREIDRILEYLDVERTTEAAVPERTYLRKKPKK